MRWRASCGKHGVVGCVGEGGAGEGERGREREAEATEHGEVSKTGAELFVVNPKP